MEKKGIRRKSYFEWRKFQEVDEGRDGRGGINTRRTMEVVDGGKKEKK